MIETGAAGSLAGVPLREALARARRRLADAGLGEADLDARLLFLAAIGLDGAGLILRGGEPLEASAAQRLDAMLEKRLGGMPVGRILGRRAFGEHDFALSPDTLEPRPDTEALVDLAEALLRRRARPVRFADIGTGTGAIAVSLLARLPDAVCLATDLSPGALDTARQNARAAGVEARFLPACLDYCEAMAPGLDAIVTNPPYIPSQEVERLSREVRDHDPRLALDGGTDGLDAYRAIAAGAARVVKPGGLVAAEIGIGQERDLDAIMSDAGFGRIAERRDLGGVLRALAYRRHDGSRLAPDRA